MEAWAVGDFNEDGRFDWITAPFWGLTLVVGYDAGALIGSNTHDTSSASRPSMIVTGDFSHDQRWDLALIDSVKVMEPFVMERRIPLVSDRCRRR